MKNEKYKMKNQGNLDVAAILGSFLI